jgi:glucose-6-phosphate 1-dehydrogenase
MRKKAVSIVVLGGTGDLAKRKLVPAFARLVHDGVLAKGSDIIGISRKKMSDKEYKDFLCLGVKDKKERKHIRELDIRYLSEDISKKGGLGELKDLIRKVEPEEGRDRVYYLATSFKFFPGIVQELKRIGLHKQRRKFTRIVFEKPFGEDLKSSNELDKKIHKVFPERDVFRIDHYLAKETVQNLNVLKFMNPIFGHVFSKDYVESVEIIVDEKLSVGKRISFYESAGALKDMIQNHLLQVLSLFLMARPREMIADEIHDEKIGILKKLEILPAKEHLLGQYEGYKKEAGELGIKNSRTETFVKLVLNCKNKRWDGVKLILRTGKKLKRRYGQIRVNLKDLPSRFNHGFKGVEKNRIIIDIQPEQNVTFHLNTNKPNAYKEVLPVKFEFLHSSYFGANTSDEYATLLRDILRGSHTLFSRSDEVRESWRIVEDVEKMRRKIKFVRYRDGGDPESEGDLV